ncbi:hypothetical protein CMO83_01420 [Candidatus Woesearchaeota archaeon]|mgnify:CR=1 FL=1|jgi:23S rRNA pseudouridine2605 synthase|nr:hypothetical protein [Candidatus Woesearchaeota archaeon]MDP6647974.1 pseudouridine synthase [Candidatus Woesearchaeota archaeon]|tara:strand:- start:12436 stop:13167 length:732 start_codon:yes stop_codon:yes gene_type:complete
MSRKTSLKQFLMKTGRFSRADEATEAIRKGKITLNGLPVINPNYFFNPKKSIVKIENEKLKPIKKLYFILNKPKGHLCQKSMDEKSVYDIISKLKLPPEQILSLFSVGRLDRDTEGLLIITNDGRLSDSVMQPSNKITKKYNVMLEKEINKKQIRKLENGVIIKVNNRSYKTKPTKILPLGKRKLQISIEEGKKKQIRKMFETLGYEVIHLNRISIGSLQLKHLKIGQIKQINRSEIMDKLGI